MEPEPGQQSALPLEELELSPQWVKTPAKSYTEHTGQDREPRRDRRDRDRGPRREPPPGGRPARPAAGSGSFPRPAADRRRSGPDRRRTGPPSQPSAPPPPPPAPAPVDVTFVPDEKSFTAMIEALKQSARAFALFDLAKLVLNKPERHSVTLTRKPAADRSRAPFYLVVPERFPFLTEEEAVRCIMQRHADRAFKQLRQPVEPPKGNFTFVNRCGITGEWLGPPNYHEYQSRLVRHHQQRLRHLPFDQFKARIQTVKDPEAVKAWVESMSFKTAYECRCCAPADQPPAPAASPAAGPTLAAVDVPVEPTAPALAGAGEEPEARADSPPAASAATEAPAAPAAPVTFASRAEVEKHFLERHLAEFLRVETAPRLSGPTSRQITHGGLFEAVRLAWEGERRFPLKTANQLRPRLQREGLHFFKDRHGITYISRIRPTRFEAGQSLTERVQRIVAYLRTHEGCHRKKLLAHLLTPTAVAAPGPGGPPESGATTPPVVTEVPAAMVPAPSPESSAASTPPPAVTAAPVGPQSPAVPAPEEQTLLADLHWLIHDGYVVEFSDGRLWALEEKHLKPAEPPPSPAAAPVPAAATETPPAAETAPAPVTPDAAVAPAPLDPPSSRPE